MHEPGGLQGVFVAPLDAHGGLVAGGGQVAQNQRQPVNRQVPRAVEVVLHGVVALHLEPLAGQVVGRQLGQGAVISVVLAQGHQADVGIPLNGDGN